MLLGALAVGASTACGPTGEATTRIGAAEAEVEAVVDELIEVLELEVTDEQAFGARTPCDLPTAGEGASNTMSLRGPLPEVDDPLGRVSAVLDRDGYELVDGELEEGVFGRRDGIFITVALDAPTDQLLLDASTGCRPVEG